MMAYTKDWSPRIPCRRNIGTKHHIKTLLHPSANKQTSATINIEFVNTMFRTEMHAWNCKSDIIIQFSFKRYLCNMVHIIGQWYLFVIWPIMTPGETLTLLLGAAVRDGRDRQIAKSKTTLHCNYTLRVISWFTQTRVNYYCSSNHQIVTPSWQIPTNKTLRDKQKTQNTKTQKANKHEW